MAGNGYASYQILDTRYQILEGLARAAAKAGGLPCSRSGVHAGGPRGALVCHSRFSMYGIHGLTEIQYLCVGRIDGPWPDLARELPRRGN